MMIRQTLLLAVSSVALALTVLPAQARPVWTKAQANAWYAKQPWLVGANYTPATASNQFEMWQADSFDPATIDKELGWAQASGMNTMRVFLHNELWEQDPEGFKARINTFLEIAHRHGVKPMFVLFDSCWDPDPKLGRQHPPVPGVHNSVWVQAPGAARLADKAQYGKLRGYVEDIVGSFAQDERILAWDIWNEPDNDASQYPITPNKEPLVRALMGQAFGWARDRDPIQPLTSGVWHNDDWSVAKRSAIEAVQLEQSDVISFHDYSWPEIFERRVRQLQAYGRPILCTEYMARGAGSTFDGSLPLGKKHNVAMMNWGLVDGKTQTRLPWDSWQKPYVTSEPTVWFHEVFHADGTPYRPAETRLIKALADAPKGVVPPIPYAQ